MPDGALFRDLMAYYDPDKQPIQEFRIIHSLVEDPNNSSPDDAVKQILGLTNHHLVANYSAWPVNTMKGEFPWGVISLVMEIAAYTPLARQGKLLEFIICLQKNTVKDPRTNQGVKYNGEGRIWDELPMLRVYVSDFWFFSHDKPQPPSKIQEWENKTSFLAKITASSPVSYAPSVTSVHPMDYSHYGLYACREAFEEPHDSSSDGGEGASNMDSNGSGRQYETQVRTACIWFIHAGKRLYHN